MDLKKGDIHSDASEFVKREQGLKKSTIAPLTKNDKKYQPMKYGTVQIILNTLYEWKNAGYSSLW